ncbi:DUF2516 family protein [Nocardioides humilatus]|uniref:DUF2516 family protein n=1 Tax=Nocardioides humilatus TaxID=2607660 RepID=A0A5B1LLR5_9ACTN|nr:DUF2516 family protein [Nocardioides humilatus]KAA1421434.1 DUF2516 family protein [Nocardioides humilatus]
MGGIYWAPPVDSWTALGLTEYWILIVVGFALLVVKIFAFANALLYSGESYLAADKLNKATWTILLGVAIVLHLAPLPIGIINLAMTVAALVYLADVRPALAGLRRR